MERYFTEEVVLYISDAILTHLNLFKIRRERRK